MSSFGERLKQARLKAGLTYDELAKRSGRSKSYLWELENRAIRRPSANTVYSLADALGVSTDYLFAGGEDTAFESGARFMREQAAALFESVNAASDDERIAGDPGAGAMGAVLEYRNAIRHLPLSPTPPQNQGETS